MRPRLSSFSFAALVLAGAGLILSLTGCQPKPTHEIGKVEYDKLVDWKDLFHLGPAERRAFLGKVVTFHGMHHSGYRQFDDSRENSCLAGFVPYLQMIGPYADDINAGTPRIGVYVNYGKEVTEWLPTAATDTFLTDISMENVIQIEPDICKKCLAQTQYDHEKKEYFGSQSVDECLLESKALHITGRVIGIDYIEPNTTLILMPTGLAW